MLILRLSAAPVLIAIGRPALNSLLLSIIPYTKRRCNSNTNITWTAKTSNHYLQHNTSQHCYKSEQRCAPNHVSKPSRRWGHQHQQAKYCTSRLPKSKKQKNRRRKIHLPERLLVLTVPIPVPAVAASHTTLTRTVGGRPHETSDRALRCLEQLPGPPLPPKNQNQNSFFSLLPYSTPLAMDLSTCILYVSDTYCQQYHTTNRQF